MTYGYLRLSTNELKQSNSFEVQKQALSGKYRIDRYFSDTVSGNTSFDKRPGWTDLMGTVKKGDRIVVHRMDRLSRNSLDFLVVEKELLKRGVSLVFVEGPNGNSAQDQMIRTILSATAQLERSMIAARVKETRQKLKREGRYGGGKVPYGYSLRKGRLVKNTKEQRIIEMMAKLRKGGMSYGRIAEELNGQRVPTKNLGSWQATQIMRILKSKENEK